ncbi:MAG TPA: restriction endonuclease [Verrucomicrobiae bacterium]|nr:restriction endonuclease [Verrucomicrobiae bacterium]
MNTSDTPANNETSKSMETSGSGEKSYYLIRSCRAIRLEDGVVGIGWDGVEFRKHTDVEALIRHMTETGENVGRRANDIRRFKSIRKGDIIVVPLWGTFAVGVAKGEDFYDSNYSGKMGCNQHRVEFYTDSHGKVSLIPRENVSEALQRRLRVRPVTANLVAFQKELDDLIARLEKGQTYSWTGEKEEKEKRREEEMKKLLLNNIRRGKTGLKSGGIGLEDLVKKLLEIDGYTAKILGKKTFLGEGDADIEASKTDMLQADDHLVQVKHHNGITGFWGQHQLNEIKEREPEEYKDHKLALVTSGEVPKKDKDYGDEKGIKIFDGDDLVSWIFDRMAKLDSETKRRLGVSRVPEIIG